MKEVFLNLPFEVQNCCCSYVPFFTTTLIWKTSKKHSSHRDRLVASMRNGRTKYQLPIISNLYIQVENLLEQAKYSIYNKEPATDIDFEDFVRLYLNHRPAFGDNYAKMFNAFRNFASFRKDNYVLTRNEFIKLLYKYGKLSILL